MNTYEVTIRKSEPIAASLSPDAIIPPVTPFSEQKTYIMQDTDMIAAIKQARQLYKTQWQVYKATIDAATSVP